VKPFFLSLKWQAVISVSLMLALGVGLVAYFGQINLEQTYQSQRNRVHQDRQKSVNTALATLQREMTNIANHMQGIATRSALSTASPHPSSAQESLYQVLKQNWDQLNFEWGLGAINLYSLDGNPLFTLGAPIIHDLISMELIQQVGQTEAPMAQVYCNHSCWQVVAVPILLEQAWQAPQKSPLLLACR